MKRFKRELSNVYVYTVYILYSTKLSFAIMVAKNIIITGYFKQKMKSFKNKNI